MARNTYDKGSTAACLQAGRNGVEEKERRGEEGEKVSPFIKHLLLPASYAMTLAFLSVFISFVPGLVNV